MSNCALINDHENKKSCYRKTNGSDNQCWQDLMRLRVEANELISEKNNEKLSRYEEKISMRSMMSAQNVSTTKVKKLFVTSPIF